MLTLHGSRGSGSAAIAAALAALLGRIDADPRIATVSARHGPAP